MLDDFVIHSDVFTKTSAHECCKRAAYNGLQCTSSTAIHSRTMIFNVGEIYALRGDFVIDQIWGAISVSRGAISADKNILKF